MPHKHIQSRIKVPSPPVQIKVKVPVKLKIGVFSGYDITDVKIECLKLGVKMARCDKLRGLFNKKYYVEFEGYKRDINKLMETLNNY